MLTGKIRSLNADKGFGFIQPSAGGPDLFFHCSAVDADFSGLKLEQSVEYEIDAQADKPRASKVLTGAGTRTPGAPASAGGSRAANPKTNSRPRDSRPRGDSRPRERRAPKPDIDYLFGYITKLPRKNPIGFISATTGGHEYYFEPTDVKGTKFTMLAVGDYVRFIPRNNPDDPKQPLAKSVEIVPKPINKQENNLARHPKARRKKPTWKR